MGTLRLAAALAFAVLASGARAQTFEPDAPVPMSATVPADVDPALRDALLSRGELMLAHRLFERQQWAAFIALNWPVDAGKRPRAKLAETGDPAWTEWIESFEVFREAGERPAAWGSPTRRVPLPGRVQSPVADPLDPLATPPIDSRAVRVPHDLSAIARVQAGTEVDQAFSFAVWDRNGNPAHYEILMNRPEYDFIVGNGLFHAGGIADYVAKHGGLSFPAGRFEGNRPGAADLKLAWRILDPRTDDFGRYLTQPAFLPAKSPEGLVWTAVTVGLIGFHIAQKTETAPQWIWSTFEQVDNLSVDALAKVKAADGRTVPLRASFFDEDCPWCAVNVPGTAGPDGTRHTQIARLQAVPAETEALNGIVREQLRREGSKLAFYKMIGTQWPTRPELKPGEGPNGAVANASGGAPLPVYLANAVMETFAQVGNTRHPDQEGDPRTGGRMIFANGSCMACHAQSPYDFSWLLTKAQMQPRGEPALPPPSSP